MTMSLSTDSTTTTTIMGKPGVHNQGQGHHVHKRRSSRDSDDELSAAASISSQNSSPSHLPPRPRMISAPSGYGQHTRSASGSDTQNHILPRPTLQRPPGLPLLSPVRTSFHMAPPPNGVQINGHSRARSISAFSYSPRAPSPLSTFIQVNNNGAPSTSNFGPQTLPSRMQTSYSASTIEGSSSGDVNAEPLKRQTPEPSRRSHNRIHSRNLSIYFPRPGSLPTSTISELEDGTQEVSIHGPSPVDEEPGRTAESRESFTGNSGTDRMRKPLSPLGQGFTFGSRPPSSIPLTEYPIINPSQPDRPRPISPVTVTRTRRGHHHKHSLSHNFFSFLEPGYTSVPSASPGSSPGTDTVESEPNVQSISVPVSSVNTSLASYNNGYAYNSLPHQPPPLFVSPTFAKALSITNLSLGATLWVSGQQAGSLACTGLGYWVVYDAIGLALSRNFDFGLGSIVGRLDGAATVTQSNLMVNDNDKEAIRRPYGASRLSTLLTFAQSVYLMFSAVYVCKETIEHVLLSAGEGHHHHPGDEGSGAGLELPLILTFITFFSLLGSALLFDSNSVIVNVTQTRIPPLLVLLRTIRSFTSLPDSQDYHHGIPFSSRSRLTNALTNPFVLSPLIFCIGILVIGILVSSSHQRLIDLLLASFIAFITFNLAYRACVILGTVLLQTSPARTSLEKGQVKTSGREGQMEAFLRAMREVERHPHVLHLPAPHIWQIAPVSSKWSPPSHSTSNLVVTLELHVRAELGDEDVLELTRWAWERVIIALGGSPGKMSPSPGEQRLESKWMDERPEEVDEGGPEVTVGIVRG